MSRECLSYAAAVARRTHRRDRRRTAPQPRGRSATPGACPLCGSSGVAWGRAEGVTLRRCDPCGVSLAWAWPSEVAYGRFYSEGERYHREEARRHGLASHSERFEEHLAAGERRLRAMCDLLPARRETLTLLDIGAGNGAFVAAARRHGIEARGLEPNQTMVDAANARGLPLVRGSWRRAGTWGKRYDVITLHDVIEHVTRPAACLELLRRCLEPGGLLILETPEWTPERTRDWRHLKPREHLCLYSETALRELVCRAGLYPLRVTRPVPEKLALYARS